MAASGTSCSNLNSSRNTSVINQHASFALLALTNASASFAQSANSRGTNQQYNRGRRRRRGRGNGRGRGHYSAICYHRFDKQFQGFRPQVNQGGGF
ncbi:hypothetical protein ACOSQ3_015129 [Xanthoceras sorbifolium]